MKKDIIDQLIEAFPEYADHGLIALPDGWLGIVNMLFRELREIQKLSPGFDEYAGHVSIVDLDWKLYASTGCMLYVRPRAHVKHWTADMALRLVQVVSRFNDHAEHICEVCGQPNVGTLKYQDHRRQERLCQAHMDERQWS